MVQASPPDRQLQEDPEYAAAGGGGSDGQQNKHIQMETRMANAASADAAATPAAAAHAAPADAAQSAGAQHVALATGTAAAMGGISTAAAAVAEPKTKRPHEGDHPSRFLWPEGGPDLPDEETAFELPDSYFATRRPQYEHLRTSIWVSKQRPKRMPTDQVSACSCSVCNEGEDGCKDNCLNRLSYIHCDSQSCPCGNACSNRPFHELQTPKMDVFLTKNCGWGVRAAEPISKGSFVVEYCGEVIDEGEGRRRTDAARQAGEQNYYIMELQVGLFIDARSRGNMARLLNSSCAPNCETQKWIDAATNEKRIGIFATTDICAGEELTYDYTFELCGAAALGLDSFQCMCGAATCRGTADVDADKGRDRGRRLEVYRDGAGVFYRGTVIAFSHTSRQHTVLYDDGETEKVQLDLMPHRWLEAEASPHSSPRAPRAPRAPPPHARGPRPSPTKVVAHPTGGGSNEDITPEGSDADPYCKEPTGKLCRVFISHAGEKNMGFVDFLQQGFEVQYPLLDFLVGERSQGGDTSGVSRAALEDALVVVLVLSEEFVSTPMPMEELHLLLERRRQGSNAELLPVFYEIPQLAVMEALLGYTLVAGDELKQQWAKDLQELLTIKATLDKADVGSPGPSLVRTVVDKAAEFLASINQLPVSKPEELPDIIIGHDAQAIDKIISRLRQHRSPKMLILSGMGGIGKTTLAKFLFNALQKKDPTALCHFLRLDPPAWMDPLAKEDSVMKKQGELLHGLTGMASVKITSPDDGQAQLLKSLAGKRVLVVVDNVWGDQLEAVLGCNILTKLGVGSVVLVTSRESGSAVEELHVDFLSDMESMDLLCRHGFEGTNSLSDTDKQIIQALVARCGGLPMAVEVVGRHLAGVSDRRGFLSCMENELTFAYGHVAAGRLEKQRTMFEELQLSWEVLEADEKEALLDIVWFLRGQPWELVRSYCGEGVLEKLHMRALVVRRTEPGGDQVQVHPVMVDFCKLGANGSSHEGQRLELASDEFGSDPIWDELSMVDDARGLALRGHVLDTEGCRALSQLEELRVLWLSRCNIVCSAQLPLSRPGLSHLGWLSLEGPYDPGLPNMQEQSLQLQGMGCLAVLLLACLPELAQLRGLQDCPALRVVSVSSCGSLQELDISGLTSLEQLRIRDCGRLQEVTGVPELCALTRLVFASCAQLPELDQEGAASRMLNFERQWLKRLQARRDPGEAAPAAGRTSLVRSAISPDPEPIHAGDAGAGSTSYAGSGSTFYAGAASTSYAGPGSSSYTGAASTSYTGAGSSRYTGAASTSYEGPMPQDPRPASGRRGTERHSALSRFRLPDFFLSALPSDFSLPLPAPDVPLSHGGPPAPPPPQPPMPPPNPSPLPALGGKYMVVDVIGRSSSSTVVTALDSHSAEPVAAKVFNQATSVNGSAPTEVLHHNMLSSQGHPHVISFRETFISPQGHLCLAMDHADSGTLHAYVMGQGCLTEEVARQFFQELILAVDYCHHFRIVLRNIDMEHVLLCQTPDPTVHPLRRGYHLKLCSFGCSKLAYANHDMMEGRVGSLAYMAPEVIQAHPLRAYDGKVADVWSCGVVLFSMVYGQHPFDYDALTHAGLPQAFMMQQMLNSMLSGNLGPPHGHQVSPELQSLIGQLLHPQPNARPSVSDIFDHPWFAHDLPADVRRFNSTVLASSHNFHQSQEDVIKVLTAAGCI